MHHGRSINHLMDELGHTGLCFFLLQEMCAEKLEPKIGRNLTADDCLFSFHLRVVLQALRLRPVGLERLLSSCQAAGLLQFEFCQNEIKITMPILLDLLDRDTKKARQTRAAAALKPRQEKRREDKEEEKKREEYVAAGSDGPPLPAFSKPRPDTESNRKVWEAYREAYLERYRVEPVRNAAVNTIVSSFVKRLGASEAPEIARFYVGHNGSFYVKNMHSIAYALKDAEALRTQWLKGRAITESDVRKYEKDRDHQALLNSIDEEGI